jgi:hypothetical protein
MMRGDEAFFAASRLPDVAALILFLYLSAVFFLEKKY